LYSFFDKRLSKRFPEWFGVADKDITLLSEVEAGVGRFFPDPADWTTAQGKKGYANDVPPPLGRTAVRSFMATPLCREAQLSPGFCHLADRQDRGFFVSSQLQVG
jgi:hypothetical protein